MSEAPKQPPPSPSVPPRPSNPSFKAISAARQAPLAAEKGPPEDVKVRLKAQAENTALNVVSILKETWQDFRNSDRFFKYKAGIIGGWIALSVASFVVANPGKANKNPIGAKLVINRVTNDQVYVILNESDDVWEDVKLVLNKEFEDTAPSVEPNGLPLTLDLRAFKGKGGARPPSTTKVIDLVIDTSEGDAVLVENGKVLED